MSTDQSAVLRMLSTIYGTPIFKPLPDGKVCLKFDGYALAAIGKDEFAAIDRMSKFHTTLSMSNIDGLRTERVRQ